MKRAEGFRRAILGAAVGRAASLCRLGRLISVLARHTVAGGVSRLERHHPWAQRLAPRLAPWLPPLDLSEPERLRATFQELGGAFLKLGQLLAMQPDLLPPAYHRALFDLFDRVSAEDFTTVEKVVVGELGEPPEALFDQFDPQPLASASIGQVHRARGGGVELVVKIQRPGAERDFRADVRAMRLVALVARHLAPRRYRWVADHLDELAAWTLDELDYRLEARSMEAFWRQSRGSRHQRVPRVVRRYCSRRVLTMELLVGSTVVEWLREPAGPCLGYPLDRRDFARRLIDNFLHQAFVHGRFHADLHPANLMVLPSGAVGYLDLGITGQLSPFVRQQLVAMTFAYTSGELEAMGEVLLELSISPNQAATAEHRRRFRRLGETWYEERPGLPKLRRSFTEVLLDMLRLSRVTGVWPEREVLKYVRSLMAIDTLVRRLVPTMDLGSYLERACRALLRRRAAGRRREWLVPSRALTHLVRAGIRTAEAAGRLAAGQPMLCVDLARDAHDNNRRRPARRRPSDRLRRTAAQLCLAGAVGVGVVSPDVVGSSFAAFEGIASTSAGMLATVVLLGWLLPSPRTSR